MHETECSEKMYLAGEEVAEAEGVDIAHAHTPAVDSCLMNSGPPDRVEGEAGQAEDIDHKALQVYHTVHSTQRHRHRWERSAAAEEEDHKDHKLLRRSVAVDIEYSVAGSGHIDAVAEARAGAEATTTGTAQDMVVVVDVADDALTGEGELGSGEAVDVGVDGGQARERDVGAEVVGRT